MQILLAVDATLANGGGDGAVQVTDTTETPSETLLKRLRFGGVPNVEVVHVVPPPLYNSYALEAYVATQDAAEAEAAEAARCEEMVRSVACRFGRPPYLCRTKVMEGAVVVRLLERADQTGADMIAVNGSCKSEVSAFLEGSTVRSLIADAHCSLLIAKAVYHSSALRSADTTPASLPQFSPSLNVVLATDHSPYMEKCIERLLHFGPRGIGRLTVLTVYPQERLHRRQPRRAHLTVPLDEAVQQALEKRNAALIETLRKRLCSKVEYGSRIIGGCDIHSAISQTMADTGADLLILGAHGHGFVERLTLGSVSYREAAAAPYSVLLLRV